MCIVLDQRVDKKLIDMHGTNRNKIRLYKALIKPILCFGSVTWTLIQTSEQMLNTFERKILRRIYGPTQEGMLASQMES
jgi:hypothetical protein